MSEDENQSERSHGRKFLIANNCTLAANTEERPQLMHCFSNATKTTRTMINKRQGYHTEQLLESAQTGSNSNERQHNNILKISPTKLVPPHHLAPWTNKCSQDRLKLAAFPDDRNEEWHEEGIKWKTKIAIYRAMIPTALLYGCETLIFCYYRYINKCDRLHI